MVENRKIEKDTPANSEEAGTVMFLSDKVDIETRSAVSNRGAVQTVTGTAGRET